MSKPILDITTRPKDLRSLIKGFRSFSFKENKNQTRYLNLMPRRNLKKYIKAL